MALFKIIKCSKKTAVTFTTVTDTTTETKPKKSFLAKLGKATKKALIKSAELMLVTIPDAIVAVCNDRPDAYKPRPRSATCKGEMKKMLQKREKEAKKAKGEKKRGVKVLVVTDVAEKRNSFDSGYDSCKRASTDAQSGTTTTKKSGISHFTSIRAMKRAELAASRARCDAHNAMVAAECEILGITMTEWLMLQHEKSPAAMAADEKRVRLDGEPRAWQARRS
ncbi:hypothetical protein SAICODRAFT_132969 [Saitoella complicata NRRL Y-17804]|nr:uncharacterized protein SAICODRAFT_132969 [Saitoella complicata NRRL Y-17804]ODQ52294.1 hypothetical protein SAICODRAFT_132969 [Saitoella complicata NRRL Y-17804]